VIVQVSYQAALCRDSRSRRDSVVSRSVPSRYSHRMYRIPRVW